MRVWIENDLQASGWDYAMRRSAVKRLTALPAISTD
jgi:hypothetical protein